LAACLADWIPAGFKPAAQMAARLVVQFAVSLSILFYFFNRARAGKLRAGRLAAQLLAVLYTERRFSWNFHDADE